MLEMLCKEAAFLVPTEVKQQLKRMKNEVCSRVKCIFHTISGYGNFWHNQLTKEQFRFRLVFEDSMSFSAPRARIISVPRQLPNQHC